MPEDDPPKPRHPTMQVDIEELYASLEGRVSMPPPLPASSPPPSAASAATGEAFDADVTTPPSSDTGMSKGMLAVALLVATIAAVLGAYFSTTLLEPEPPPATTMEVGPIEVE